MAVRPNSVGPSLMIRSPRPLSLKTLAPPSRFDNIPSLSTGRQAPAIPKIQGEKSMTRTRCAIAAACGLLLDLLIGGTALAQKQGGVLKMYHFDSPASLSLHEEVTFAALGPAMGLFNNLVMFDQHVPQASFASIVPDLATEWSWDSSKTELRFRLREGVKWHDGRPFSASDVKCTWDTLLGKT